MHGRLSEAPSATEQVDMVLEHYPNGDEFHQTLARTALFMRAIGVDDTAIVAMVVALMVDRELEVRRARG